MFGDNKYASMMMVMNVLFYASGKAICFAEIFSNHSNLTYSGIA